MFETVSPREYADWGRHLSRFPPGEDRRTHYLLAQICVMIASVFYKDPSVDIFKFAPWLQTAQERKRVKYDKNETFFQKMYAGIYDSLGLYDVPIEPEDDPQE